MNIWQQLPKQFFALAPMDDVTDIVFRRLVNQWAVPDVAFTEFANVDGLQSAGREEVLQKLRRDDGENNAIAQVWGLNPDNYRQSAAEIADMGFAGIDINMGCPVAKIIAKGSCSALIKTPELAAELIAATKDGAGELPVSVKTRIGFNEIVTEEWCGFLLEQDLAALTVHGRTSKEQSKVDCHWDELAKLDGLRCKLAPETVIVGNGDVTTREQGLELMRQHQLDGIMIGRGVFANPYVFAPEAEQPDLTMSQRIEMFIEHIEAYRLEWGDAKNPAALKKFAKTYIREFEGASDLRDELMQRNDYDDFLALLRQQL
jgi:tRNA-dihydrouridine synthase